MIVPEAYAGPGRRAARLAGQQHAASRAVGLELAIWDRHRRALTTFDEPADQIDAWIAGPAALLVAKTHKVHERLLEFDARPDRLRPKDSGDVTLLMMVSQPDDMAHVMATQSTDHPEIAQTVGDAAKWLTEMYGDPTGLLRRHAVNALADRFETAQVAQAIDDWLTGFTEAARAMID